MARLRRFLHSFRFILVFTTMVFILLGVIISLSVTTFVYSRGVEEKNENQTLFSFAESENNILRLLSNAYVIANSLYNTDAVAEYMISDAMSDRDITLARFAFVNEISRYINSTAPTSSIAFFNDSGRMAGCWTSGRLTTSLTQTRIFSEDGDYPFRETLRSLVFSNPNETIWLSNVNLSSFMPYSTPTPSTGERRIVCGIHQYVYTEYRSKTTQPIILLFEINSDSLYRSFSLLGQDGSDVYLVDSDGIVICGTNSEGEFLECCASVDLTSMSDSHYRDKNGEVFQVITYPLPVAGWSLVKAIPRSLYIGSLRTLWKTAVIVGVTILVVMSVLSTIWVRRFCEPIDKLVSCIKKVQDGNLDAHVPVEHCFSTEMLLVSNTYNDMLDSLELLLAKKESNERELMALEIRSLQAQVTPHFIYNTITSIRWMATAPGADNVAEALIVFSDIIHPIFTSWTRDWCLFEEFEFVSNYIKLMRMRFGNRVVIVSELEDSVRSCRIPRFALQTLLENCCEHGGNVNHILHISLSAKAQNDTLCISVSDDGVGIPADRLEELWKMLSGQVESRSIGLVNLNRRLQLFHSVDSPLEIDSMLGNGTAITIRLPQVY